LFKYGQGEEPLVEVKGKATPKTVVRCEAPEAVSFSLPGSQFRLLFCI